MVFRGSLYHEKASDLRALGDGMDGMGRVPEEIRKPMLYPAELRGHELDDTMPGAAVPSTEPRAMRGSDAKPGMLAA